jgi:hypothetical protein
MVSGLAWIGRCRLLSFLFLALALFCVVRIGGGGNALPMVDNGYRVQSLTDVMLKTRVISSLRAFTGTPMTFTIVDSASKPVPGAELLVKFPDSTVRYKANSQGKVTVSFDSATIAQNPIIKAAGARQWPNFSLTMTAELETGKTRKINFVVLDSLLERKTPDDILFYPAGYDSVVGPLFEFIPRARAMIQQVTGLTPTHWGTVLSDKPIPVGVSPPKAEIGGRTYYLFPYSLLDDRPASWYLTNVHEWTENTIRGNLKDLDLNTRWVYDGVATYVQHRVLSEVVAGNALRKDLVTSEKRWLDSSESHLRRLAGKDGRIGLDLLKWQTAGPNQPIAESEIVKYQLAFWFWWDLSEKYGEKVISEFLTTARQRNAESNRELLDILVSLTGDKEIQRRLKDFEFSELKASIQAYRQGLPQ